MYMNIRFFDNEVDEFLKGLHEPTLAKVGRALVYLERFGPFLGMPHSKSLGQSLFELRIHGHEEVRLLYTFDKDTAVILHSFLKKSQKIAASDLQTALRKKKMLDSI